MDVNKRIKRIVDQIEYFRELNPEGEDTFTTTCDKLSYPNLTFGEFNSLLKKLEHEGFVEFQIKDNSGYWGGDTLKIKISDWSLFQKYRKKIYKELKNSIDYWKITNPAWFVWQLIVLIGLFFSFIKKHKIATALVTIVTFVITIIGLLAIDTDQLKLNINYLISQLHPYK